MKFEEFKDKFNSIISDPEKGISEAPGLLELVSSDYETIEASKTKISELESKIRDLQDSNIKLYLAQTGAAQKEDDPEPELSGMDAVDEFIKNITNGGEKDGVQ